jgi:hypothetical protein
MTNPLNGQPIAMPSKAAVGEHLITLPMAIAVLAFICSAVAAAGYFGQDSPNQKMLLYFSAGLPLLSTQLAQIWHSRNVRNKMMVANQTTPPEGVPALSAEEQKL